MTGRGELKIGNDLMTFLLGEQDMYEVYAHGFDIFFLDIRCTVQCKAVFLLSA